MKFTLAPKVNALVTILSACAFFFGYFVHGFGFLVVVCFKLVGCPVLVAEVQVAVNDSLGFFELLGKVAQFGAFHSRDVVAQSLHTSHGVVEGSHCKN